jgi:hypothetical protein
MAHLGAEFDPNKVDPARPIEPLPTGWYAMVATESEIKDAKAGGKNKYLEIVFAIDESRHPQHKGRKVWARLNLWNDSAKAEEIASSELSAICHAVGSPPITDSQELHFKPLAVRVVYKPATEKFGEGNDIKGYDAIAKRFGATGSGTPTPGPSGASASSGAAPAESATPPWGK